MTLSLRFDFVMLAWDSCRPRASIAIITPIRRWDIFIHFQSFNPSILLKISITSLFESQMRPVVVLRPSRWYKSPDFLWSFSLLCWRCHPWLKMLSWFLGSDILSIIQYKTSRKCLDIFLSKLYNFPEC